jgi:hypothetical protein
VSKPFSRYGKLRGVLLACLVAVLLFLSRDVFTLTPVQTVASPHLFPLMQWEMSNFPKKWIHLIRGAISREGISQEQRFTLLDEYLQMALRVQKEKDRLERLYTMRGTGESSGTANDENTPDSRGLLRDLVDAREDLRADAEEALEAEVDAAITGAGLGSRWGLIFPPVDIRLEQPPTLLITSSRDRIQLQETILLRPDLNMFERDRLENEMLEGHNVSALVVDLGGLGTYPSLVSDLYPMRTVFRTAVHEWVHAYFFFRPLGRNFRKSEAMATINETAAALIGRELGDSAFAHAGGNLSISPSQYLPVDEAHPVFTREMRNTRLRVEQLLAEGKVEEAESYMKERWWFLKMAGFGLRKLNQAYFAFHTRYAQSPGSVDPIGDQIKEIRSLVPDLASFTRTMAGLSSHEEFLDLLERLREQVLNSNVSSI